MSSMKENVCMKHLIVFVEENTFQYTEYYCKDLYNTVLSPFILCQGYTLG